MALRYGIRGVLIDWYLLQTRLESRKKNGERMGLRYGERWSVDALLTVGGGVRRSDYCVKLSALCLFLFLFLSLSASLNLSRVEI